MLSLSILIHNAINSGDIDTVYSIIDDEYSKNSKNPCVFDQIGYMTRIEFVNEASWAIPDEEAIELIARFIGRYTAVEVGAGNGLWAALVKHRLEKIGSGGTIIATDDFSWPNEYNGYIQVEKLKAVDAINEYSDASVLILIWPPYGKSMAFDALSEFKGDYVVYIGEGQDGCTGDDYFHQCISDEWEEAKGYFTEDGNFHRCLSDEWQEANRYFTGDDNFHQLLSDEFEEENGYSTGDDNFHKLLSDEFEEENGYSTGDDNFHKSFLDKFRKPTTLGCNIRQWSGSSDRVYFYARKKN
jgi:hypothetical protein